MYRCCGSHAKQVIHCVCPFNESPNGFPVDGIHNLTVLSILPEANNLPFGDHEIYKTQFVWPMRWIKIHYF
jgi:hypothetical protein